MDEVTLSWLQPDGQAGGRTDAGKVVRVHGALPGDRVRVVQEGKNVRLDAVLVPSPDRVVPSCPVIETCGGCDLGALALVAQQAAKQRMVQVAFRREALPQLISSPRPSGHRARISLTVREGVVGYRRQQSHELVPIEICGVARPEVQAQIDRLREVLAPGSEGLSRVELRSDGQRVVFAAQQSGRVDDALRERLGELGDVALDGKVLHGDPTLTLTVGELALRASPLAFYQVNLEGNLLLVQHIVDTVMAMSPERVLGLYAGMGNLELPFAVRGIPVVAVEREGQSMQDLVHNAAAAKVSHLVTAITQPVERFDTHTVPADVLILDPPRAGAPGVLKRAIALRPRGIVYVSCHAPSAARDLKPVLDAGYHITDLRCFDLFPDTHHVETVITLRRG